jgi:hypothetical protein
MISAWFQYACQSNLPSTVRVLVQIGFANIQTRNSDTGKCFKDFYETGLYTFYHTVMNNAMRYRYNRM